MRKFEVHVGINKELKIECEKELDYSIFNNEANPYYDHEMSKGQFQGFLVLKEAIT